MWDIKQNCTSYSWRTINIFRDERYYVEAWKESVYIRGIDEYGFLRVERINGTIDTLIADAHSLDIKNNIIKEKIWFVNFFRLKFRQLSCETVFKFEKYTREKIIKSAVMCCICFWNIFNTFREIILFWW